MTSRLLQFKNPNCSIETRHEFFFTKLSHVHAAVHVEDLAGDITGFVAGEKDDGGGDVAVQAETAERDHGFHFVFDFLRERVGHRRFDEAGRNGVHGDAARGDFDGDGAGEADESGLGGDVIRLAGVAGLGHHRADIDDAAGTLLEHSAERLLDAEMRPGKVGANYSVPVFEPHAQRQRVAGDGRVIDQDVELGEFREDLLEPGFDLRGVGDVHRDGKGFATSGFDFGDESGEFFSVARGDRDFCAGRGQRQSSGAADSLRGAGDECDFIFQRKHKFRDTSSGASAQLSRFAGFGARLSDFFQRVFQAGGIFDVKDADAAIDLAQQAGQNFTGADFDEDVYSRFNHFVNRIEPAD